MAGTFSDPQSRKRHLSDGIISNPRQGDSGDATPVAGWTPPTRACATDTPVATPAGGAVTTPLVALLTRHVLTDGELILLILKPSLWFIVLHSLRFIAGVLILIIATQVYRDRLSPIVMLRVAEFGMMAILVRLMWATLHWMGRYYILTDMRIVRMGGIFALEIFTCPLRRVARVRRVPLVSEKLVGVGSMEIIPLDESLPVGYWQTIARPKLIYHEILAAISRAKQGV